MSDLPRGTVTFVFTDVEASTALWARDAAGARTALALHDALIEGLVDQHEGCVVRARGEGDSCFAVFARASDAIAAACDIQRAVGSTAWPTPEPLRIRMALHTGEAELRADDYYGSDVNRCARMRAIAHGGQILLSAATADLVWDGLPEGAALRDLGYHWLKDLPRPEHVYQLMHPALPSAFPPPTSLGAPVGNLPPTVSSFVGREREVADIHRLLGTTRLLTLTGSGGVGKTRLAQRVASEIGNQFDGGVWFVELGTLTSPDLVPQAVGGVLGVRGVAGQSDLDGLLQAVMHRRLLLVLDNCEHLLQACAELVANLLRSAPALTVLATSREPLRISGEVSLRVGSLGLPEASVNLSQVVRHQLSASQSSGVPMQSESVQLFVDRARAASSDFMLTQRNAGAVVTLCRRLDGIPLALELSAPLVRVLSVQQIVDRLSGAIRLLGLGSRTAPPRHRTLRATLDWSFDLLSPAERVLLGRLSVFSGGWTLEAAEAVCAGQPIAVDDVLDLLGQLVDRSLVTAEGSTWGDARYRLLETIRQYALERLEASGEADAARHRHAAFFSQLALRAESQLTGLEQTHWFDTLEREHDNLRAALRWSIDRAEAGTALSTATALSNFWWLRSYFLEGLTWLSEVLTMPEAATPDRPRARALVGAGVLAVRLGEYPLARQHFAEALEIGEQQADTQTASLALVGLSQVERATGALDQAAELGRRAVKLTRDSAPSFEYAFAVLNYANAVDLGSRRELLEEAVTVFRRLGSKYFVANALHNLGVVAEGRGEFTAAAAYFEEALGLNSALGATRRVGFQANFAWVLLRLGHIDRAAEIACDGLLLEREMGSRYYIASSLSVAAGVAVSRGQPERAACLSAAAEKLLAELGARFEDVDLLEHQVVVESAQRVLSPEAFAAQRARGDRELTLDDAIELALDTLRVQAPSAVPSPAR